MPTSTSCFRVIGHFENGGKQIGAARHEYVQAAAGDYDTLKNVLVTNQGKSHGGSTFVVDNVANVGPGNIEQ